MLGVISGPVEGILALCVVYASTAYLGGGHFWQRSMLETLGVSEAKLIPDAMYGLAWNDWYMVYGGIMLVFNTGQRFVQFPFAKLHLLLSLLAASSRIPMINCNN